MSDVDQKEAVDKEGDGEASAMDGLFNNLIFSLYHAAMFQMGRTPSPISGKVEVDLPQARVSVDMLRMIREKTQGNLKDEQKEMLDRAVFDLEMMFVEESKKGIKLS